MVLDVDSSPVSAGAPGPLAAVALAQLRDRALDQVGAAIVLTDATGRIVDWTPGATRLFGWTRDEAIGRRWDELAGPVADDPDPRRAQIREGLAEGRSYTGELTVSTRDGRRIPIIVDGGPIRDAAGQVVGAIGIAIDDSRRSAAEQRFEIAFRHSPVASVITVAPRQLILDVNPAFEALSGYARADVVGRTSNELGLWAAPGIAEALQAQTVEGAPVDDIAIQVRDARGRVLEARIHGRPITLADGPAYLWTAVDETERLRAEREARRLQERLHEAEKLESIGHLAGGIAHDFNNLMTTIGGYTEMAMGALGPDHRVAADLVEVRRAADRAAALTQQLLAFSRRQVIAPERLDLDRLVRDLLPSVAALVGPAIDVDVAPRDDAEAGPSIVLADPGALGQVVTNLAANARDAMPGGGRLCLSIRSVTLGAAEATAVDPTLAPGRYVQLLVEDTGIGMDDDTLAHGFDPFFTTKPDGRGAGLGLSVVHGIVRQSGGAVHLASQPGAGTVVTVTLPAAPVPDQVSTSQPADRPAGTADDGSADDGAVGEGAAGGMADDGQRPVVLIAEDEPAIRRLAARVLERAGHRVVTAEDGRTALGLAATLPRLDVLLTDLTMPHLGGVELAQRLTATRPDVRVVYMSGYGEERLAEDGVLAADVRLLHKPFDMAALVDAIDLALTGAPAAAR